MAVMLAGAAGWLVLAPSGSAEIRGSKHDFTTAEWSGGSACMPCHVPHRAAEPKTPKWGGPAVITRGTAPDAPRPGALSRACLTCHDGNTARDTFGDEPVVPQMPARSRIGAHGDLRSDHPVGVAYPSWRRDFEPVSRLQQTVGVRLFEGKVECSSCHDPHNSANLSYLLVMPNERSQMCLTCHRK